MKQKLLILLFATLVGTGLTQASVVIDGIAYVINETKNVAVVTSGGTYTDKVVIPATITYNAKTYSVVSIGTDAFRECSKLTSVTIPNSVTSIGDYAFRYCKGLTSVTIPNSVTSIGEYAFDNCRSLTSITIPNSVTNIGGYAFSECYSLTSVHISDIAAWFKIAFGNDYANPLCNAHNLYLNGTLVTDLVIPNSVTSIGFQAFYGCRSLTSITIPNSVTSIEYGAFEGCSSLKSVHISDLAAWCKIAFGDFYANPLSSAHNLYLNGTLVTDLVIPDGVTSIESYAFYGCSKLTSITIPNSVTSIGDEAFRDCSSLTSITIPNSVTSIKDYAFASCGNLIEIYDYRETPQSIYSTVFSGVEKTICTLYVPNKAVSAYQNAEGWKEFKDIVPFGFNTFTITTAATNGTVTGGGLYAEGSTATLNATPNTGYRFTQWSDGNTDNPRTVTVTGDQKYTAMFVKVAFTVTVNQNCSITVQ